MLIKFNELKQRPVSKDTAEWMQAYGTNHVALYKAWERDESYYTDTGLLLECLAWAIQRGNKTVAERILSRYRRLRGPIEDAGLKTAFVATPDCLK
jgi:hypothetical protein